MVTIISILPESYRFRGVQGWVGQAIIGKHQWKLKVVIVLCEEMNRMTKTIEEKSSGSTKHSRSKESYDLNQEELNGSDQVDSPLDLDSRRNNQARKTLGHLRATNTHNYLKPSERSCFSLLERSEISRSIFACANDNYQVRPISCLI